MCVFASLIMCHLTDKFPLSLFNEGHCYGCKNTGSIDMKHPNEADAYSSGHVNGYSPVGGLHVAQDDFDSLSVMFYFLLANYFSTFVRLLLITLHVFSFILYRLKPRRKG